MNRAPKSTDRSNVSCIIKPTFSSRSLETSSKYSVLKRNTGAIADISQLNLSSDDVEPRLRNWDRWVEIHKKQQEDLSVKLNRPPQCMVMNTSLDRPRLYVNQEKRIISEASNFDYCDKFRGHPCFWKTDDGFTESQGREKYDRSKSKIHCPHPAELEYVGVPDMIYREKGLSGKPCLPTPKQKWNKSEYVMKVKENLKEKLNIIQEHIPELSEVAIQGTALNMLKSNELINETDSVKQDVFAGSIIADLKPITESRGLSISIVIENKTIAGNLKLWTVDFKNCFVNTKHERFLVINNFEESSLKYSWKRVVPYSHDLPIKRNMNCFYFDKKDAAILPGLGKQLNFYFKSDKAGVFCEKWQILLSNSPDQWEPVIVELQAVAIEASGSGESLRAIDLYIDSCKNYTLARKTVNDILKRSRPERVQDMPYNWKFFEEQIFIFNNPDFYYDSKCVSILNDLHNKICDGPWDFSLINLRHKLLQKLPTEDVGEELEIYISNTYKLMKPNLFYSVSNEKYNTVYDLLCCFVNKMESESNHLSIIYEFPYLLKYAEMGDIYSKASLTSTKVSLKASQLSRKSTGKKYFLKTRSSHGKKTQDAQVNVIVSDGNSVKNWDSNECEDEMKKQEYLETLYVKTYHFLSRTIDHISMVIDSFDTQKKKNALSSLKNRAI